MKRASYRDAVKWIALNDNAGEDTPHNAYAESNIAGYISTCLVADLFGKQPAAVAHDVMIERRVEMLRDRYYSAKPDPRVPLYGVVRWCCTSGQCIECLAKGDKARRVRVVQTWGLTKERAEQCAASFHLYEAEAVSEASPRVQAAIAKYHAKGKARDEQFDAAASLAKGN